MAKKIHKQDDAMKTLSKIKPKKKEQKPVPFDELLLKAIEFEPKKKGKK